MRPLEHINCAPFDAALQTQEIMKTPDGFYITWMEWNQVPEELKEQVKAQVDTLRAQQNIPPDQEMKPFVILGKCPYCMVDIVEQAENG